MSAEPRGPQILAELGLPPDFQMDIFLVAEKLRSLGKLEEVPDTALDSTCGYVEKLGLHTRAISGPGKGVSDVFFAHSHRALENVHSLEKSQRLKRNAGKRAKACRAIGKALGYPSCCVESFIASARQNDEERLKSFTQSITKPINSKLNFFPRSYAPTGYLPCTPKCPNALRHSEAILKVLEQRYAIKTADILDSLSGIIVWASGPHFLFFKGVEVGNSENFHYEDVYGSHELISLPETSRHKTASHSMDSLLLKLREGDRLFLQESGAVVYSKDHEVLEWNKPGLSSNALHFARMDA